jgi:multidrug efflux system membrane fusion protein
VKTAQLNVNFTHVSAPISGRISDARATVGNLVTQDSTILTTIVSLDPIRFNFEGPESLFLKYKRQAASGRTEAGGAPVEIRLQDEPTYRWPGHLEFVDNALDTSSGTIRVRASIDNADGALVPGLYARVKVGGGEAHPAVLISDAAVSTDQAKKYVLVVDAAGKVQYREIQLGSLHDNLRVVTSGLKPGERIVVDGIQHARPNDTVRAKMVDMTDAAQSAA